MKRVLIICTANKLRSVLAMEIANSISRRKKAGCTFKSGGIAVLGDSIDENVRIVLSEIGIETIHTPTSIDSYNIDTFDEIHVMSERQKIMICSYYKRDDLMTKIKVLNIKNPFGLGIEAYRESREELVKFYESTII